MTGCIFKSSPKVAQAPGKSLAFSCALDALEDDAALTTATEMKPVYFTAVNATPTTAHILISDERFNRSSAAVMLIVDRQSHRVDQVRNRDGKPFEGDLTPKEISADIALAYKHIKVGSFLLDNAAQALAAYAQAANTTASVGFVFENKKYVASKESAGSADFPYGPIPRAIDRNNINICRYDGEVAQ